jgi:hypothetical protein
LNECSTANSPVVVIRNTVPRPEAPPWLVVPYSAPSLPATSPETVQK